MPPPLLPRKPVCRADLFNTSAFTSWADVEAALVELKGLLTRNNFLHVVDDFLDQQLVVELILSNLPPSTRIALTTWIIEDFPTTANVYDASIASKLLSRLSSFFVFQPLPLTSGHITNDLISRYHRRVLATPKLLASLSSMTFRGATMQADMDEDDDPMPSFVKVKSKSQKKRIKQAHERGSQMFQEAKLLEEFLIPPPYDRQEAERAISKILADDKSILQFYFEQLHLPEIVDIIQKAFTPSEEMKAKLEIQTNPVSTRPEEKEHIEVPSAYPMVQPMKSALHFNSAEGFGEWRILISTRADGDLREARRKDRKTFAIIVKKIKELSNGHFSDDNMKRLNGPNTDVPIFEAKMTRDTRLVYQVDSVSDYESHVERQVLRIFGIYTHAQLDNRLWESIGRQLGKKGKEYKRRCMHREHPAHSGDNVFLPASFPPLEVEVSLSPVVITLPPDDLEQIHSLLVLEKYLTFSQELLHSILADLDVAFPFQVSPQEKEIIEHPYSCYVLGRSGTGKTTTMLFKMLWIERTHQLNSHDVAKPRQIFVTKSRVLAGKVEEYFLKLLDSLKTASQSPQELKKLIQARKVQAEEDADLVDIDDEDNWRNDLPVKFSELQDSHFPLFITFDRLCELVEADFDLSDRTYNIKENKEQRTFVSYDLFLHQYWPHFPQPFIKGLDPALVFSEIIGRLCIIKGSEETIASRGYLDRNIYEELSGRTQSTFARQRNTIYSIFEVYQARKRQRGDFDAADRTHGILRGLANHGVTGRKIDQLCVDEAQDNLLIDALLLRSLSHNTDGLFWAGDTAQTISVGSSFRFDDLKAFLFRIENQRLRSRSHSDATRHPPKTFQLATNYRSHAGIVNCAQSVIELITRFWPYSIDTLAPEKGIVDGLKPVFLNGWNDDNVRYEQFLFGSSGSHIEFGAQQCILVRDEAARHKLQEQVGDIGLIMTLYESKGLEFNDVLLFNFFEDSTVELSQWRLLLSAVNKPTTAVAAPRFEDTRHAGVCAELKFLYVAITRARKNLWIADHSTKGEPMRVYWTTRDQIHNCTPGTDMPRLAVSSSTEEWANKGKELFERKKFLQAKHCYERALMPHKMAISNSYYLRDQARKAPLGDSRRVKDQRYAAFTMAAEAFLVCAQEATKNRTVYFRRAAECFESGAEDLRAANVYLDAREYNSAAKLFRKLGRFDEAVAMIKANEEHMQSDVVESIKDVARLYYFREEKLEKARQLFSTDEEELEYLEDLDLDIARAEVLTSLGRPAEAAELHLLEGRTLDAIPLFLRDKHNSHSMRQASQCILREFWRNLSFGIAPGQSQAIVQLLEWSSHLNMRLLDVKNRSEIAMFKAIIEYDMPELTKIGKSFLEANHTSAATLCLGHLFRKFPQVTTMTAEGLAETLHLFLAFIRLLYEFAFQIDPRVAPSVTDLFGIQHISGDEFLVPVGTFLHHSLQLTRLVSTQSTDLGISVTGWELCQKFRHAICDHLLQRISEQSELCRNAPQFSPCLRFVAFGYCNRIECPQDHTPSSAVTIKLYNARVRVNLQQVLILHVLYSVTGRAVNMQQRIYIGRFYEAVNPPLHYLGTPLLLDMDLIPEFQKGIYVIRDWLRGLASTLDFMPQVHFLTNLMRVTSLGLRFDRHEVLKYLYRSPCLTSLVKPSHYLRPPDNEYVLYELIASLEGSQSWSISAGILSLRHILHSQLPVNVSVLCDFIEYLCASLVISDGLQRKSSLHGIMLPRSWLLRHIGDIERARAKATNFGWLLVEPLGNLLETIYSGVGAEYLLFGTHDLSTIPGVRGVFVARICRVLCLLGYNNSNNVLRSNILKAITKLQRVDRKFPLLYRQYIYAQRWDQLVRALCNTLPGSLADELVQTHDLGRAAVPTKLMPGVRLIHYKTNDDLPLLLRTMTSSGASMVPRMDPSPHYPKDTDPSLVNAPLNGEPASEANPLLGLDETGDADDIEITDPDLVNSGSDEVPEMQAFPIMAASDIPQDQPPTAAELRAASTIQKAYKRALLRRRQAAKTGLSALRTRKFSACLEKAQNMVWKANSSYRPLFLGPLPHILLCLDIAHDATLTQKNGVKKRLRLAHHEALDGLGLQLTELGKISKSISRLQKALETTSDVHIRRDVAELRRSVHDAVKLLRDLPYTPPDFRRDLDIAYKGIVAPRKPPKAPQKPALVCEEDI